MPCKGICELDQRVLIAAEVRRDGQFISTRLGAVMGLGVARLLARPSKLPVVTLPSLLLLHTVIFRPGTCGWLNVTRLPWADYTSMWLTPFPPLFSLHVMSCLINLVTWISNFKKVLPGSYTRFPGPR